MPKQNYKFCFGQGSRVLIKPTFLVQWGGSFQSIDCSILQSCRTYPTYFDPWSHAQPIKKQSRSSKGARVRYDMRWKKDPWETTHSTCILLEAELVHVDRLGEVEGHLNGLVWNEPDAGSWKQQGVRWQGSQLAWTLKPWRFCQEEHQAFYPYVRTLASNELCYRKDMNEQNKTHTLVGLMAMTIWIAKAGTTYGTNKKAQACELFRWEREWSFYR